MAKLSVTQKLKRFAVRRRYGSYARYPLLEGVPPSVHRGVLERFYFDNRRGYFYARVPKAANSTIVATLRAHSGLPPADDMDVAKREMNNLPFMSQYRRSFQFTFTRDPATRVLSAYLDKIVKNRQFSHIFHGQTAPSFPEFLQILAEKQFLLDAHFLPQHVLLPFEGKDLDLVGRIEALDDGLRSVCPSVFNRYDGLTREAPHATGAGKRAETYLNHDTRALIFKLYERDFELYDYDPEL